MSTNESSQVDEQLANWQQGDVVLSGEFPALHLANLSFPGTPESRRLAAETAESGLSVVPINTLGFVLLSQTCDVVRACEDRPYVEICPVVELPEDAMPFVRHGRRGQFIALPGLGNVSLAGDLDRTMTMEKFALVQFGAQRQSGVTSEAEARELADALGRKRARYAFPGEFVHLISPLQKRAIDRYNKNTSEGRFLRAVREIRVRAIPDWSAEVVELEILFVFNGRTMIPTDAEDQIDTLLQRVQPTDRYVDISGRPVGLDQLSAATYLESIRLDLEHLSAGKR